VLGTSWQRSVVAELAAFHHRYRAPSRYELVAATVRPEVCLLAAVAVNCLASLSVSVVSTKLAVKQLATSRLRRVVGLLVSAASDCQLVQAPAIVQLVVRLIVALGLEWLASLSIAVVSRRLEVKETPTTLLLLLPMVSP